MLLRILNQLSRRLSKSLDLEVLNFIKMKGKVRVFLSKILPFQDKSAQNLNSHINFKNNEIDYYDSYGSLPSPLIHKFIQKMVEQYKTINTIPIVIYNDKRHQYKTSECGMFSMNFILERINGKTMYDFHVKKIKDDDMLYLRNILYNKK